ncbi:type II toxin-antitoxin system HipA family toxin YjjJ [Roseateles saccharophilus]|uniref:Serine/threonine protein kinase HipA of HipAB toxin-antitoxin module n=1 Tax=Roseateles saccharophilus TaxID=304 RepID=A0A4R3VLB1_ROSSA|nr:type II toxin-antitoxin system HipA family toxin YjjJ [Roseateles saccharophilus]MDG0832434.1 type II toxin-antitoxin system HipA family toxin YjjJ [Roseateles saccharophilus]TCV03895.1 serine/threonine protein kinase HipA of HipAB toxin-antitoxin module [Roseateles saccharophilus]
MPADLPSLERLLRPRGPTGLADIAAALGCSTKTAQRLVGAAGDAVVAAGHTRRRRIAWRRELRGQRAEASLYRINADGRPQTIGRLSPVWPQGCHLDAEAPAWPAPEEARDGWYGGLPYPLYDLRPQGFLGRAFARRHAAGLGLPPDPRMWDDNALLLGLAACGDDLPGDLLVGDAALRRFLDARLVGAAPLGAAELPTAYADLAAQALEGALPGSSAGGEFPKFTAARELAGMATPHCVVKFSGPDDSATVQRWRDLLVCEHLAAKALGDESARTRLLAHGGRHFLEIERFDRIGAQGRRGVVSLESVNAGLVGAPGDDWTSVARALAGLGLLSAADAERATERQLFGQLIGNSDMHGGNLGFFHSAGGLGLAPSYDQLPMRYAPQAGGEVLSPPLTPALPLPAERERWVRVAPRALAFWQAAAGDERISPGFRALCADNHAALERAVAIA